jgi:hypothetical protein
MHTTVVVYRFDSAPYSTRGMEIIGALFIGGAMFGNH